MIGSYFRTALRFAFRNKAYTTINFLGLATGLCGAMLLLLWVHHEFSFEQFHRNKDQLYVAWNLWDLNGSIEADQSTPRVLAPTLEKEFAAVDHAVSYATWGEPYLFQTHRTKLISTNGAFTEPAFLTMFTFPLAAGNPITALQAPNSIVITERFAIQLFGTRPALGEPLSIGQAGHRFEFVVTGVMKDLPPNTDFHFDFLLPFGFLESLGQEDTFWGNNSVTTLVQLKAGADPSSVNDQIRDVVKKHYADGQNIEVMLHPLVRMRLYASFVGGVPSGGRIETVRLLILLAAGLVLIAAINFINLSTARSQRRAREVAVRKVTGAQRFSLITQFLSESLLMTLGAGCVALFAAWSLIPAFSTLVGQSIPIRLGEPSTWMWLACAVMITALLAGSYPALYLSSFLPVHVLKGRSAASRSTLRTGLVILQFGTAFLLVVSAIVVNRQIDYVQHRDAGYSMDNLVYVPLTGDLNRNFQAFTNELSSRVDVVSMTKASAPLTEQWSGTTDMVWRGKNPEQQTNIERIYVDDHITTTAGLTILQGRDMDLTNFPTDSTAALLNETALTLMGFDNPIGEVVRDGKHEWHVIGVIKDFIFTSPYQPVEPIILFGNKRKWASNTLYIRFAPDVPMEEALDALGAAAAKYNPEYPFEYHFANADYRRKFTDLQATLRVSGVFTILTLFVASLGLLGMAMYVAESRTKEIGIRKVMGGSVVSLTRLLGYTSLKPVLLSMLFFLPVSWYAMNFWLSLYAFHTTLDVEVFALAATAILTIALVTIGWETIRAARVNPVESIRNE